MNGRRSITSTLLPDLAAAIAAEVPAEPAPITIRSKWPSDLFGIATPFSEHSPNVYTTLNYFYALEDL